MALFKVMREKDLAEGERVCREIGGRTVTIMRHQGRYVHPHPLDAT